MRQCWTCQLVKFEITEINFIRRLYRSNNHEPNSSEKKFCYFWLKKWVFFSTIVWKGSRHHLEARNAGGPISILIWYLLKKEGDFRHHRGGWTNWIVTTTIMRSRVENIAEELRWCWASSLLQAAKFSSDIIWMNKNSGEFFRSCKWSNLKDFWRVFSFLFSRGPWAR